MSRYKEAYVAETEAFVESLCDGLPAPCTGRDGLIALVMAMAAGKSYVGWGQHNTLPPTLRPPRPTHLHIPDPTVERGAV